MSASVVDPAVKAQARELLNLIDASPSPWHAVATMETRLSMHGFRRLEECERWTLRSGGRCYVVRDDSSIIAFVVGAGALAETGFRIVGAHTDSPGLRVKPNGPNRAGRMARLGVEVYGGPILATFTDRDLSLAGRITLSNESGRLDTRLVDFDRPLVRLPNLAIHMNRKVNEEGLRLDKQKELPVILSVLEESLSPRDQFLELLSERLGCAPDTILSWDLNLYDTQKGAFWGPGDTFLADSQLDNLTSCHAALVALLDDAALNAESTAVCAFFDHEEIGSQSMKGADGRFLPDILERIAFGLKVDPEGYKRALACSFLVSADMAHAWQPNFPAAYEPDHHVIVNDGPVIKVNANLRYTSESVSEAIFMHLCERVDVPCQKYSHRTDIPCGSTIGPMASAGLGIRSVDVGSPMWAMHSIRESAGALDHTYMIKVLRCFFSSDVL
jgi:aspartyl aminopeptidase